MSFLSHIGLSVIDKITGNALDKVGNAIKDGDVDELVKQFTGVLNGVEDKLGDVAELFEDAVEDGKKDMRREINRVKRQLVRETRAELESVADEFGEVVIDSMRGNVQAMVAAEVERQKAKISAA